MCVDIKMRAAYEKWRDAFYNRNLSTTPAYDLVGLLAALCIGRRCSPGRYFDVGSVDNVTQEGAVVYKLKESFRSKETLSLFRTLANFGKANVKLMIITDFGEECDDEVACLLADRLHREGLANVRFLFVTNRFEEQRARFARWGGDVSLVSSIYEENRFEEFLNWCDDSIRIVLQIGPIHEPGLIPRAARWRPALTCKYNYVVVGTFNGVPALNVKGDARASALHLMNGAEKKIVVDTMGGLGAFEFTWKSLSAVFPNISKDDRDSIVEHVCKIGWRNSVGRASAKAGLHVAHLVSAPVRDSPGGANYATVANIERELGRGVVGSRKSIELAERYLDRLQRQPVQTAMKLKVLDDGSTNSPHGATAASIVSGYAYILDCLHHFFEVPIEFFESGSAENWNAQWDTPSVQDVESGKVQAPFFADSAFVLRGQYS
jgi:hypothetical protein